MHYKIINMHCPPETALLIGWGCKIFSIIKIKANLYLKFFIIRKEHQVFFKVFVVNLLKMKKHLCMSTMTVGLQLFIKCLHMQCTTALIINAVTSLVYYKFATFVHT